MNIAVRLLTVICACAGAHAVAAGTDPNTVEPDPSVLQPSATAPAGARSPAAESSPASTTSAPAETTSSHPAPGNGGSDAAATPTSASKPTKIVLQDETLNGEQLKQILAMGYKPQGRGDQVLYCRKEPQMGTRFETKVCKTATVILGVEQQGRQITERAQQNNGNPTLK